MGTRRHFDNFRGGFVQAGSGMRVRPHPSADKAVRTVRILQEILGVATRISTPMLREENAVCVVSPTGTSLPNIIRPKALRAVSAG
jgi:hypothetical protein